jgi:hypothetical protein
MNKERLLELAGVKKAVGKTNAILTEEIDAKSFVRSLPLYRDLMKDQRAKPEALRTAVQFVKDFEGQPVNDNAKKWIQDELANIAYSHNPKGAFLDDVEPFNPQPPKPRDTGGDQPPPPKPGKLLKQWYMENPNATGKEFKEKAIELGMNPRSIRSAYYRLKTKFGTNEAYSIRLGDKYLGERSHPFNPNWLAEDDYSDDYLIVDSLKEAERIRDSLLLHTKGKMEIVNLDEEY